jgi:hypothetical protein
MMNIYSNFSDKLSNTKTSRHQKVLAGRHRLTIRFVDFWDSFDPLSANEALFRESIIRNSLDVITEGAPDILCYSVFGLEHQREIFSASTKVFYNGEPPSRSPAPVLETLRSGHYVYAMDKIQHPRFLRLPNIVRAGFYGYAKPQDVDNFSNLPTKSRSS